MLLVCCNPLCKLPAAAVCCFSSEIVPRYSSVLSLIIVGSVCLDDPIKMRVLKKFQLIMEAEAVLI